MIFLKFWLVAICFGAGTIAAGSLLYDIYLSLELERIFRRRENKPESPANGPEAAADATNSGPPPAPSQPYYVSLRARPKHEIRWKVAAKFLTIAVISGMCGASIVVVPDGQAAVRISQISGVEKGTLYAGTHLILPLIDRVALYDGRDQVFATDAAERVHGKLEVLTVETHEGLSVGLAITVRYRVDPRRLDYVQENLPQPLDQQVVEPVVTSAFRDLAPNYAVRDIFSNKRDEFRDRATKEITERLGGDAIVVKEVMLRKVDLPEEYAKGLEGLLEKEQEDDQTSVEADIQLKHVKIAESQAEAEKIREVKRAEADAQARVIQAKAESDSMQYTLPLKQKQIEQSKLEAEARKEATIQNAEAEAQAKVIDSKAEQQRQNLLADAEANQIRVTAKARSEELQLEAAALKSNPLLVQYTVAQKLSDKVQIMLVPSDGKFFFTNDVLRSVTKSGAMDQGDDPAPAPSAAGKP
ncbi:MAG TPA: SPFH domain-containing protein [Candidatus Acidoferrales bacterium]|nr:SPFH domain-containing protein [Candidatus Acidoferrales bacterium]